MIDSKIPELPKNIQSNFRTKSKLRPNKFYIKFGNIVVVEIHTNEDWEMEGVVVNPAYFPASYPLILSDAQCKYWLSNRIMPDRKDGSVEQLGLKEYDTMEVLYRSRGINMLDDYWLAWSIEDKAEEYHPRFNSSLIDICQPDIQSIK